MFYRFSSPPVFLERQHNLNGPNLAEGITRKNVAYKMKYHRIWLRTNDTDKKWRLQTKHRLWGNIFSYMVPISRTVCIYYLSIEIEVPEYKIKRCSNARYTLCELYWEPHQFGFLSCNSILSHAKGMLVLEMGNKHVPPHYTPAP